MTTAINECELGVSAGVPKMYYIQGVFQTDDVTRNNTQFTQSALLGGTWATSEMGVPMHVSHDLGSPIGWNFLSAVYFEPNWTRVAGYGAMPETDEEWQQLRERLHAFHSVEIGKHSDDIAQLRKLLDKHLSD